ncbi:ATP-grasp domain-containing protein [Solihabitans fulvus]|uniref:ATP-grasp domain-containing protein n=1 Tax=Solihabitans fulvus TaxID=1892852 RepID=A0A5B2XTP3_9PSEU|nr:ATP-grasp domain-containing protein [Solihabitans fulvus]KAA2267047.1 ATP-grasp domain-containing protein [Solihabitans fulvus]
MPHGEPTGPAVIVDPYSSGALFAPAFRAAGVPVVAVLSGPEPPEVYASSYVPEDFPEIITFAGDHDAVLRRLAELAPRCVLAGCESGVELADALAPRVVPAVANVPALAAARRHKGEMAAAVAAAGLPVIPQVCTADPAEVTVWIERSGLLGRDLVVKPPKSASTDGVTKVAGGRGWREVFDAFIGVPNRLGLVNDRLVVQQFVTGTEYVVDTVSHDGVHTVVDVCRYNKIDNGEYMAVYDSMEWIEPADPVLDELLPYARGVLDAVGLRFGPAHVEVMLTDEGPRLIEIGARAHGGGQPRFCRVATGDSQIDRTVRYFAGEQDVPDHYRLLCHLLVVFHIARESGVLRNAEVLDGVERLASHHFSIRNVRSGALVERTRDLFGSLDLGFAVLAHESNDQLWADYRLLRALEDELRIDPADRAAPPTR